MMVESYLVSFPLVDWRGISPFNSSIIKTSKEDLYAFKESLHSCYPNSNVKSIFKIVFSVRCFTDAFLEIYKTMDTSILELDTRNQITFLISGAISEYEELIKDSLIHKQYSIDIKILVNQFYISLEKMYPKFFKFKKKQSGNSYFLLEEKI